MFPRHMVVQVWVYFSCASIITDLELSPIQIEDQQTDETVVIEQMTRVFHIYIVCSAAHQVDVARHRSCNMAPFLFQADKRGAEKRRDSLFSHINTAGFQIKPLSITNGTGMKEAPETRSFNKHYMLTVGGQFQAAKTQITESPYNEFTDNGCALILTKLKCKPITQREREESIFLMCSTSTSVGCHAD